MINSAPALPPAVEVDRPFVEPKQVVHLPTFNRDSRRDALDRLRCCLAVPRWTVEIVDARPCRTFDDLLELARDAAYPLSSGEIDAAVRGRHPRTFPFAQPLRRPAVTDRDRRLEERLFDLVGAYEVVFERPLLIRTAGRSRSEVSELIESRLTNDRATEDRVVGHELRQVALLTLTSLIRP